MLKIGVIFLTILLSLFPDRVKTVLLKKGGDILGRQIKVESTSFDIISGKFNVNKFYIYEKNGKDIFLSFDKFSGEMDMVQLLFSKNFVINKIDITKPQIIIVKENEKFNFEDISDKADKPNASASNADILNDINFTFKNIKIIDGIYIFKNKNYGSEKKFDKVNISIPEISNSNKNLRGSINFNFNVKDKLETKFNISSENGNYNVLLKTENFQLNTIKPYINNLYNFNINGFYSSTITVQGNFLNDTILFKGQNIFKSLRYNDELNFKTVSLTLNNINKISKNIDGTVSLQIDSGIINSQFNISIKSGDFNSNIVSNNIQLNNFQNIIKKYLNVSHFNAGLSNDIFISGNFKNKSLILKGNNKLSNGKIIDKLYSKEIISWNSFNINFNEFDFMNKKFDIADIYIENPHITMTRLNNTNTLSNLFVKSITGETDNFNNTVPVNSINASNTSNSQSGSKNNYSDISIETAVYSIQPRIDALSDTAIISETMYNSETATVKNRLEYRIGKMQIEDGTLSIMDYSFNEPFRYEIEKINFTIKDITNAETQFINIDMSSILNKEGKFFGNFQVNSLNLKNFKVNFTINDLNLSDFSAFSVKYMAYPILEGCLDLMSKIKVEDGLLESENIFKIKKIKLGDKDKNIKSDAPPVKIGLSLLKDKQGNIIIDLPVKGNLNDPNFKISEVVFNTIKSYVMKNVSSPLSLLSKIVSSTPEDITYIPFDYAKSSLEQEQIRRLDLLVKMLDERQELKLELIQYTDIKTEKKLLALKLCKEKYYKFKNNISDLTKLSDADWKIINTISETDYDFIQYINEQLKKLNSYDAELSAEENYMKLLSEQVLSSEIKKLLTARNFNIKQYLNKKGVSDDKIKIRTADLEHLPPDEKKCRYVVKVAN